MIENYLLEQLITFSEEKSLSKAARKLNISQPALSKSMKKLEEIMEVSLFDRTSNSIKLNETGKVAVKYAEKAIRSNEAILTNTRNFAQKQTICHLGICSNFVQEWLNPLLISCYSYMRFSYDQQSDEQLLNGLENYNYDLIVMHSKPTDSNLYVKYYFDEQLMLTVLKSDRLANKKELYFHDLDGMSILAEQGADFWLDICKKNIANLNLIVQENMSSLDKLVKESKMPVFNSNKAIQAYPDPENKVSIPIIDQAATVSYYLVCRKEDNQKFKKVFDQISKNKR